MGDEYVEQKVRVYKARPVKQESKFSKYFVQPIQKMAGMKPKEETAKRGRLTA